MLAELTPVPSIGVLILLDLSIAEISKDYEKQGSSSLLPIIIPGELRAFSQKHTTVSRLSKSASGFSFFLCVTKQVKCKMRQCPNYVASSVLLSECIGRPGAAPHAAFSCVLSGGFSDFQY